MVMTLHSSRSQLAIAAMVSVLSNKAFCYTLLPMIVLNLYRQRVSSVIPKTHKQTFSFNPISPMGYVHVFFWTLVFGLCHMTFWSDTRPNKNQRSLFWGPPTPSLCFSPHTTNVEKTTNNNNNNNTTATTLTFPSQTSLLHHVRRCS